MSNEDAPETQAPALAVEVRAAPEAVLDVQSDVVAPEPSPAAQSASPDTSEAQEAAEPAQDALEAPGEPTEGLLADESDQIDQSSDEADVQPRLDAQLVESPAPEADVTSADPPLATGIAPVWHAEALAFGRVGVKPDVEEEFRQVLIGRGVRS